MPLLQLALRGLAYHRRLYAGLMLGTMLACGILTGALVMGDSVNRTLQDIAIARLGGVVHAMDRGGRFFSDSLAPDMTGKQPEMHVASVLALRCMLATPTGGKLPQKQLNRVQLFGIPPEFWRFANQQPAVTALGPQEVFVGERTATALGVKTGDDVSLRFERMGLMPQDAPLSSRAKDNTISSLVTVKAVLSDAELGRFGLAANQTAPHNVFVDLKWLQEQAELAGLANLAVMNGTLDADHLKQVLDSSWTLEQIGVRFRSNVPGIVQVESERVFVDTEVVAAAREICQAQPTLTSLANSISKGDKSTPYSFVEAGPAPADMRDDQVLVNQWLANQLGLAAGDSLEMAYYQLSASNEFVEQRRSFTVHSVAAMESMRVERELAPRFPGLSDVDSCRDWDIGMPMDKDRLADKANEDYWKQYGQTPKLVTTLKTGQEIWGNRFGSVTAVRFSGTDVGESAVREKLRKSLSAERVCLRILPVREQALRAVSQAIDFGGLFVGMSFFLIIAALVLLGLLCVFGLQQRSSEMGVLLAVGLPLWWVRVLLLIEAMPALLAGMATGAFAGVVYARLLLAGLAQWWPGAVAGTEIHFYVIPGTLLMGAAIALVCAFFTIAGALWRATRRLPRELLTIDFSLVTGAGSKRAGVLGLAFPSLMLVTAVIVGVWSWIVRPDNPAESFFSVGALLLIAELGFYGRLLGWLSRRPAPLRPSLQKIILTNLARRRGRSLSVAAVTASGCFLVFAVSAMQENMGTQANRRNSGTGGFGVYAEASVPVLETPPNIQKGFGKDTIPLKVRDGDDAGCLNLNHAQSPRLFGVDAERLTACGAFAPEGQAAALWGLLKETLPDGSIPALVGDSNTAQWGLQKRTGKTDGDTLTYLDESGTKVKVRLVGQLPMRLSIFQGSLLISKEAFTRLYPSEAGFRAFLVDGNPADVSETVAKLNRDYAKHGMDAGPAVDRLRQFYSVESAYLTMFLVLGGLGLVLGAGGAGIVVLRNLFERRAEIGLFTALGYRPSTITRLLLLEHGALVLVGTVLGALAAAASVLPLVVLSQTQVSLMLQAALLAFILFANLASLAGVMLVGLPRNPVAALRGE